MRAFLKKFGSQKTRNQSYTIKEIEDFLKVNNIVEFKGAKSNEPLVIQTNNMGRFVRLSLQCESSFHLDCIEIFNKAGRNVAPNKNTIISSVYNDEEKYNGQGVIKGTKNGGCGFHTKRERNPWLIIDLKTIRKLDKIVVYNREGIHGARAYSLVVESSTNLHDWKVEFDNWAFIKNYKNGNATEEETALLYAGIQEPSFAQAYLRKLKKENRHDEALKFLTKVNGIVASKNIALGPHGFVQTFALSSDKKKQKIFKELAEVLRVFNEELKIPAFISSGTLLGIVRDGALIPHDDDVDICYIGQATSEKEVVEERKILFAKLSEKGYKISHSGLAHYWCTTPGGVSLDIFTGFLEDGKCSMNPLKRNHVIQSDVLPLELKQTNGVQLYLPNNPDVLLSLNYGDNWRTPDPLWTFNWSLAKKEYSFLYC